MYLGKTVREVREVRIRFKLTIGNIYGMDRSFFACFVLISTYPPKKGVHEAMSGWVGSCSGDLVIYITCLGR